MSLPEKIPLSDLFVVVDYGYHGEPSCDGNAYTTREAAEAAVANKKKMSRRPDTVRLTITDLEDFIWENRRYERHDCEIC